MGIEWVDGFEIHVSIAAGEVFISANREGLLSLAQQLTVLAEETPGSHIHYDQFNSLEEGSAELVIEKTGDLKDDSVSHKSPGDTKPGHPSRQEERRLRLGLLSDTRQGFHLPMGKG